MNTRTSRARRDPACRHGDDGGECPVGAGADDEGRRPLGLQREVRSRHSPITYQETREVTAVGGGGAKLKITGKTVDGKDFTRVDEYSGPGALQFGAPCADEAYRFPTPLQRVSSRSRPASARRSGST